MNENGLSQAENQGLKNNDFQRANHRGFSLVELIVVIAILAILVGVAVPVYSRYIDRAQTACDEEYLETVAHAAQVYAAEHGLSLASIHVAPVVSESQGIDLVLADETVLHDDLSDLYSIVGTYTFLTSDHTQTVEYYDPDKNKESGSSSTTDADHEHLYEIVLEATCLNQGYKKCACGAIEVISALGHDFPASPDKTVGNLRIYTCTRCGYQKIEFDGFLIGE